MTMGWYRIAVFGLWFASMSWLTVCKILPPFYTGHPPVYQTPQSDKPQPPEAWKLYMNKRLVGWALSEINQQGPDTTAIHSLVHFSTISIGDLLPGYLGNIVRDSKYSALSAETEVESELITNSALNQLVHFYSKFRPKSGQSLVKIEGNVEGDKLKLSIRAGDSNPPDFYVPLPDSNVRDSFSPETMLVRDLYLGQSWTVHTCSPLALPNNPLAMIPGRPSTEDLFAKVEEETPFTWNGQSEPAWVVVYRSDNNSGPGYEKNIRNRLWIRHDGMIVRQEVAWGDIRLSFERMSESDAGRCRNEHREFVREHWPAQP
jgi:hypothetical protein